MYFDYRVLKPLEDEVTKLQNKLFEVTAALDAQHEKMNAIYDCIEREILVRLGRLEQREYFRNNPLHSLSPSAQDARQAQQIDDQQEINNLFREKFFELNKRVFALENPQKNECDCPVKPEHPLGNRHTFSCFAKDGVTVSVMIAGEKYELSKPTDEPKIKPCPFCGGEGVLEWSIDVDDGKRILWIKCKDCDAEADYLYTEAEAIELWNKRV